MLPSLGQERPQPGECGRVLVLRGQQQGLGSASVLQDVFALIPCLVQEHTPRGAHLAPGAEGLGCT